MTSLMNFIPRVSMPSSMYFGKNSLFYLSTLKEKNILLLSSKTVWQHYKDRIEELLKDCKIQVKTIPAEPTSTIVNEVKNDLADGSFNTIIGFGGGSVMDVAKLGKLETRADVILIPTTPGTGSEVSRYSVFNDDNGEKRVIVSQNLLPDVVLYDPSLLTTLTKQTLAYSIADSLMHSLEGLVSRLSNPLTDCLSITSIDMIFDHATRACLNHEANSYEILQISGLLSGVVQSTASVGLVHGCAHYFGPKIGIPHGKAVAIFALPVLEMNTSKTSDYKKLIKTKNLTPTNLLHKIKELFTALEISDLHKNADFSKISFDEAIQHIKSDPCTKTNPFIPTDEDLKSLFKRMEVYNES